MKTTKIYLVVCLTFLLTQFNAIAQYNGGNSNGATLNQLNATSCSIPSHFYAYFGGVNDGSSVGDLSTTTCGTAAFQFAYMGGNADGAATEEIIATACGIAPFQFAYMGGNNDGAGVETFEQSVCAFPAQFYAYFGGIGNGHSMNFTAPICPTDPPVASFTASATEICVGQSVTFTDTSTNIPSAWTWTFTGGTPNSSTVQNPVITYNTPGSYAVTLVAANFNGIDSEALTNYITVYSNATVTSTTPASRCGTGSVTLGATASAGTLSWYANPTGGTALGTGTSFVTPSSAVTTPYYVETVNGVCTSARTLVNATINTIPTIISTTPNSRCGTGTVVLSATSSLGGGIPVWYADATGGTALATTNSFTTPSIAITTIYYIEASNGTCTSTSRTPVIATVNSLPTVLTTTPASRCDAGTVTLGATASAGTLNWFSVSSGGTAIGTGTSFTTPSIAISTIYYVEATIGTCTSSRTAVTASVGITPTVLSVTPRSRCDAGTVTLSASCSIGNIVWYTDATGGTPLFTGNNFTTPSISITTTYYFEAVNGSCSTTPRTAVIATINTSPTITSTTPATICAFDTFIISATQSTGTVIRWFNVPTGGIVQGTGNSFSLTNWSTTTTFYAEAVDGSCLSPRVPVVVTVIPRPTITGTTPASRCDAGTVTLGATASAGTLSWYANTTGGTALGTGTSFTTPSISITTTYYVEAVNGICNSTRTAVIATINASPTITSTTPSSRCNSGSVTLSVTVSAGNVVWYANAIGGSALATTTSFTTPSIAITTTYYVEAVNGTCTSTPRIAVIATVNTSPIILTTTPGSRCDTGTVTLGATASAGVLNWYNVPTGGSILGTGTSFTTPSIATTTTYYVEANDGTCISTRTAVVATASVTPTITTTTPNSRCDAGSVTLSATASSGSTVWYANATGGTALATTNSFTTPSITTTTTYYVEAVNGSCTSIRTAVIATVNTTPTITSTIPNSRCGTGSVVLNATSSAGNTNWYNVPTGGTPLATTNSFTTPSISTTTTYYVEASTGSCTSSRTAVIATVNTAPTVLTTTPASRCNAGTVTLGATASAGTLSWYANAIGGTALGTGTSFTTPSITITTTYYVETVNGVCSSGRTAVTATITVTSPPIATANQTFCASEIVGFIAVIPSGPSIIWYDAATGGNVVPNNTILVTGTTYYASQTVSGCESTVRTPVTMTLGGCLGNDEFVANVIKLYPNPVIDFVTISSTEKMSKIEIVNMLGQIIFSDAINEMETRVDMARYAAGSYIFRVLSNDTIQIFKVIKK